ncbi:DNA-3-methyladenine glycosylase family protein [Natronobacterium gregoryi]|uniref:DNA-(apurinic or apyrimidinic site) lyase n=2 Tax=Natronobacterium gregoryi TaxID=44930 RepID=L0AEU7_NATGS|nr:DNA-3-methyladenine glycosylase [Natronobacterium gregoryi]AFZ71637.1 3-methyladenine DNA glycosylase/8-oxoguanine DNA glycosylase [Natronobacterium gregoryi SP2]ELY66692.1 8-oxoguanine DNA glycosylase domain-containing protein [Natronobacterium gregoryi SP2]PLK21403.1 DNA-3-methyladenine glycosylase 2 family protein [Natronobacterium gregoryi SP2]SFI79941.1 N-glycosylase/DNA lyase [Natronobacterium gregoryi]
METGTIPVAALSGGLDLYRTLESGQTYLWRREDGEMYAGDPPSDTWYYTVVDASSGPKPDVIRVRTRDGHLEWESTTDAAPAVCRLLRLDDDLASIVAAAPDDPLLAQAYEAHCGMRLVGDPPFGCLISFICSAQMRVQRIHSMVSALAREYGDSLEFDGRTYHAFPTPTQLATATEDELRELGLGYRAPYVVRTAEMVADGEAYPAEARDLEYEQARDYLCQFVGVGDKVADCVLLFSLGFDEAVPLDTWIKSAIEDYYPDCDCGSYAATSRAIRERFGGEYAGYAQTYVFHELRTNR